MDRPYVLIFLMLTKSFHHLARRGIAILRPETVHFRGMILPARHMRTGGKYFQRNEDFLQSGKSEAERLRTHCNLQAESKLLDIGCGPCRLPIGILDEMGDIASYCGIDVNRAYPQWGRRHITRHHSTFQFFHLDVKNDRYNKEGKLHQADVKLPFSNNSFDVIYLYSVFSHLNQKDVEAYLKEFNRLLKSAGKIFFTAFTEEGVSDVSENPKTYGEREWKGPLHCVLYNKQAMNDLCKKHGFLVEKFVHGEETDGQSAYYLSKMP